VPLEDQVDVVYLFEVLGVHKTDLLFNHDGLIFLKLNRGISFIKIILILDFVITKFI